MRKKKTLRSLCFSLLSLLLCASLLVGATFAWFTDTASTAVNTIQSGTLDIQLQVQREGQWTDAEGQTIGFVKNDGAPMTDILWEPGATFRLEPVRLRNNGNLHVKCVLAITAANGAVSENGFDLSEVIDVFVGGNPVGTLKEVIAKGYDLNPEFFIAPGGTESYDAITLQMQTTAGNGYQNLKLENLAVSVLATQAPVEYDAFSNQYDSGARYDTAAGGAAADVWDGSTVPVPEAVNGVITITTAAELAGLAQDILDSSYGVDSVEAMLDYQGVTVRLAADLDLNNHPWTPIGGFTSDYTGGGRFAGSFDGQGHTISNLYVSSDSYHQGLFGVIDNINAEGTALPQSIQNLTIHNAKVSGNTSVGAFFGSCENSNLTLSNLQLTGQVQIEGASFIGGIVGSCSGKTNTLEQITVKAAEGSFVKGREATSFAGGVAGSFGTGTKLHDINSNLNVQGNERYIGGIAGRTGGGSWTAVDCSGDVTVTTDATKCGLLLGEAYNSENKKYVDLSFTNCTASGTFTILNDGNPIHDNGVDLSQYSVTNNNRFGSWNDKCELIES